MVLGWMENSVLVSEFGNTLIQQSPDLSF